jgi:arylsulfatase A
MTLEVPISSKWSRRGRCSTFVFLLGWLAAVSLAARAAEPAPANPPALTTASPKADRQRQPNILVILADDLGYGDLGCYGHPRIKTPVLDQLAKEGLKLTSYYSGAPVCSPSRAALLTGQIPQRLGIGDWVREGSDVFLPRETLTASSLLRRANYATALVGKWHLSGKLDGTQPTPGDLGFQHWFATQNNALPTHENPVNFIRNGKPAGPLNGYSSTLIVNEAVGWLKKRANAPEPFFLYVAFHAPHERIATGDEFLLDYADIKNEEQAQYYGNVSQMDFEIGRLLDSLDQLKLAPDTLVFFSSDNGPETLNRYKGADRSYGTPGQLKGNTLHGMKLHLYEGGIRVPGILRWPGVIKAGRVSDAPVSGMDWLPTIADVLGIRLEETGWDGESVASLLIGNKFVRQRPIYWQYDQAINVKADPFVPKFALRDGDYKMLVSGDFKQIALFNLKLDPAETLDVAKAQLPRLQAMVERIKVTHRQIEALKYAPKSYQ